MATFRAATPAMESTRTDTRTRSFLAALVPFATALSLLALGVIAALPPFVLHPVLDAADSAAWLGVTAAEAQRLSDVTVHELVFGPGTFVIAGPGGGPLYDPAEIGHLRDARMLLYGFLLIAALAAITVAVAYVRSPDRAAIRRRVSRGGLGLAIGIVVLGAVAVVAFEPAFELFHRIFFPGGNFTFDPTTERLVQLYPYAFWQLVSGVVGVLAGVLGLVTWRLARR